MSHFVVLVAGEDVDKQLEPFWELDLSQEDAMKDPRAAFDDRTEEVLKGWEKDTTRMGYPNIYVDADHCKIVEDGVLKYEKSSPFDLAPKVGQTLMIEEPESWYKINEVTGAFTNKECSRFYLDVEKIEGFPEVSVKQKYKDIDEYAEDYHGYQKNSEGKYGWYDNPNVKWDWYVVGGRWTGYLKLKNDALEFHYGKLGTFDHLDVQEGKSRIEDIQKPGFCDSTYKKNIDVDGMEKPKREKAEKDWDEFHLKRGTICYADIIQAIPNPSDQNPFHQEYKKIPEEMRKWIDDNLGWVGYDDLKQLATMSREEYVACQSIWCPYALLWNGKWYGRGEMGWWGISLNNEPQWKGTFRELWAQIPEDTLITTVDCHI